MSAASRTPSGPLARLRRRLPTALGGRRTPPAGRRVLVTGGASGLGLALVTAFAARGDRVLATDLAPSDARPASLPAGVDYLRLDVRSEDEWHAVREEVERRFGGLDILVNNAGVAQGGRIDRLTEDDWALITDINLLGVARGCRVFAPLFLAAGGGRIVNVASAAGLIHPPAMSSYNAVKAGVVALSESARWDLKPYGVDVSVVCPSFFRTNLGASLNSSDPQAHEMATKLISGSRRGADQIAAATIEQIDAGRFLVLPDSEIRWARRMKRLSPMAYDRTMLTVGSRLAKSAAKAEKKTARAR